jgi:hypothetical protein
MYISIQYCRRVQRRRTSEVLQQLDLTQRTLRKDLLAEDIGDLLDGHTFASLVVGRRTIDILSASCLRYAGRVESYQTMPYAPCPNSLVTL